MAKKNAKIIPLADPDEAPERDKVQHPKKRAMLAALQATHGLVSPAIEQLRNTMGKDAPSRSTHYRWMEDDEEYATEVEAIEGPALDLVESKLMQLIEGVKVEKATSEGPMIYTEPPNLTAIIFYLKCKGKRRGYVERQEVDMSFRGKTRVILPEPLEN